MPWHKALDVPYTNLPISEETGNNTEFESDNYPKTRPSRAKHIILVSFNVIIALLAGYGLVALLRAVVPAHPLSCNCGETIEEARLNECVYDSLAAAWLPPHCRSAAITKDFESFGPNEPDKWGNTWGYWSDKNKTRAMTVEEVSMLPESARKGGQAHFFATHEWHVMHCIFYWRKMWESGRRARGFPGSDGEAGQLVVEKRYDTLMHIRHCMTMLTKQGVLPDGVEAEAGVALHSDEIHIAKPHRHHGDRDSYDEAREETQHEHHPGGPRGEIGHSKETNPQ
ncbi:hypothetical protein AAE478_007983 [Parahypoxylon ruwenzoriense]